MTPRPFPLSRAGRGVSGDARSSRSRLLAVSAAATPGDMSGRVRRGPRFRWALHLALLPMVLTVLFCYIGTMLWSVRISTTSSHTFPASDFVGVAQYVRLFN